ncbi:2-C-methyl-D-erythritol 2,4-cyclodiphosphate synthase [Tenuibacillus multivorans]|uniref:Bifunctional enzyme IspD/IspF n=1 Tax=Tenuibacillus multivorans TaxID=237069 RepID=A0A1H0F387_9BACI|nr:2-C-methyl-D-erythritol 2,4-cyclodiphosphate synthase [Tenuibacillus multivorans]SDN89051.1 2-C-methyl-D-erythritol 4-phosphate cytidylyltransferase/2-C-methyl-D-erythritol 4-phosphate cytidylyltransferase / 2-C-methyl-D-erythritol 2,4-cyclodiphosphate synthase [Tenuibacillus multivorans]
MSAYQVIVLAAGQGRRMKAGKNKQLLKIGHQTLIEHTLQVFENDDWCQSIYIVVHPDEMEWMERVIAKQPYKKIKPFVKGGKERQDSVRNGVKEIDKELITFVHDGARPFVTIDELHRLYEVTEEHGAAFLGIPVTDTIKKVEDDGTIHTLNRDKLVAAQTPQAFTYDLIKQAHDYAEAHQLYATDDVALLEYLDQSAVVVKGHDENFKITNPEDIQKAENMLQINRSKQLKEELSLFRVGQGFDVHQLVEGRPCIIGGVEIPHKKGLLGHSDADVLLHTIADAALGAIGEGDIGKHFPDTDPAFKDLDSKKLLSEVWEKVEGEGYELGNVDCTIIAQAPKMSPYIGDMRQTIAKLLKAQETSVNVKATTTETLGFPGRKEGIAAQANILLQRKR